MEIVKIKHLADYKIQCTFKDGKVVVADLRSFIVGHKHPSISKYEDVELFKTVRIDMGAPAWGDNDWDINPESIYNGEYSNNNESK